LSTKRNQRPPYRTISALFRVFRVLSGMLLSVAPLDAGKLMIV